MVFQARSSLTVDHKLMQWLGGGGAWQLSMHWCKITFLVAYVLENSCRFKTHTDYVLWPDVQTLILCNRYPYY